MLVVSSGAFCHRYSNQIASKLARIRDSSIWTRHDGDESNGPKEHGISKCNHNPSYSKDEQRRRKIQVFNQADPREWLNQFYA